MRDLRTGQHLWRVTAPEGDLAVADGRVAIGRFQGGLVDVYGEATGRRVATYHLAGPTATTTLGAVGGWAVVAASPPLRQHGTSVLTLLDLVTGQTRRLSLPVDTIDELDLAPHLDRAFVLHSATTQAINALDDVLFVQIPLM